MNKWELGKNQSRPTQWASKPLRWTREKENNKQYLNQPE
jgi:hypothetical protein